MTYMRTLLLLFLTAVITTSVQAAPTIIIKADDIYYLDAEWIRFFDCVEDKGIRVSVGVLGQYIDNGSQALIDRMKELHENGTVEFWNHGYTHRKDADGNPEFQNQTYAKQLETINKTQNAGRTKLGITFTAFAATFNMVDVNTAKAVRDCGDFGVWMYGLDIPEKGDDITLLKRENVEIEYPTLNPDYDEFLKEYGACSGKPVLTLQCHPGCWDDGRYAEFVKIVDCLIEQGCRFETPSRYCGVDVPDDSSIVMPADTVAPVVAGVSTGPDETTVTVYFSEKVVRTGAENPANYSIDGLTVTRAALGADAKHVVLTVSAMVLQRQYSLSVQRVTDLADPVNAVPDGVETFFTYEQCVVSTSAWQTVAMDPRAGSFTAVCDITPLQIPCNGLFTLSNAAASGYSDCAVLVRFGNDGRVDARNGGVYEAENILTYAKGTTYHVELDIDVAEHRYSVRVTPAGGSPVVIAADYAFRTEQAAISALRFWNVIDDSGRLKVCNVGYNASSGMRHSRTGINITDNTRPALYGLDGTRISAAGPGTGIYLAADGQGGLQPVLVLQ